MSTSNSVVEGSELPTQIISPTTIEEHETLPTDAETDIPKKIECLRAEEFSVSGEFVNGVPHGQCVTEFSNGSTYVGQYRGGQMNGTGILDESKNGFAKAFLAGDKLPEYSADQIPQVYLGQFRDNVKFGMGLELVRIHPTSGKTLWRRVIHFAGLWDTLVLGDLSGADAHATWNTIQRMHPSTGSTYENIINELETDYEAIFELTKPTAEIQSAVCVGCF